MQAAQDKTEEQGLVRGCTRMAEAINRLQVAVGNARINTRLSSGFFLAKNGVFRNVCFYCARSVTGGGVWIVGGQGMRSPPMRKHPA